MWPQTEASARFHFSVTLPPGK